MAAEHLKHSTDEEVRSGAAGESFLQAWFFQDTTTTLMIHQCLRGDLFSFRSVRERDDL